METHPVSTLNLYNQPKLAATNAYNNVSGYTKSASSSVSTSVSSLPWWAWVIVIIVLALFGINIFIYLAKGTQILANISDFFASIFLKITKFFAYLTLQVTKQITNIGALGAKTGIDVVSGTINAGADTLEQVSNDINIKNANTMPPINVGANPIPNTGINTGTNIAKQISTENNELTAALNNAAQSPEYMADETSSSLTMSKSTNKAGWCYIGEEQGYRSCIDVGVNDMCMSGDIFPSKDICINPTLR